MGNLPRLRQVLIPAGGALAAVLTLAVLAGLVEGWSTVSMIGPVLDMTMAIAAGVTAVAGLRWLDRINGRDTTERINALDDRSFAHYLAGRLLAVAILLGLTLS